MFGVVFSLERELACHITHVTFLTIVGVAYFIFLLIPEKKKSLKFIIFIVALVSRNE